MPCRTSLEVGPGGDLLGDDVDVAGERVLVRRRRCPDRENARSSRPTGCGAQRAGWRGPANPYSRSCPLRGAYYQAGAPSCGSS